MENKQKVIKSILSVIGNIFGWIICLFFILSFIVYINKSILVGILSLIIAILSCPAITKIIKHYCNDIINISRRIFCIILFVIIVFNVPSTEDENDNPSYDSQFVSSEKSGTLADVNTIDKSIEEFDALEGTTDDSNAIYKENTTLDTEYDNAEIKDVIETNEYGNVTGSNVEGSIEVHFIDVGQGDATLLICNGHSLLIDAGDNTKGTTVQLYLAKHNVTSLDAVIWTHPDADHIGGADVITTKYDIGTIYMPDIASDTLTYEELMDAIAYRNYKIVNPVVDSSFDLGGAEVTFLGSTSSYGDDNNNSIICKVKFGNTSFLFTGDAEKEAESLLVEKYPNMSIDVYEVGHHGSKTSSSSEFVNLFRPTYSVISCGNDNTYGYPHDETLKSLSDIGCEIFRTDIQGNIVAISDGTDIIWETADSSNSLVNEDASVETVSTSVSASTNYGVAPEGATYIGNSNNMKLHKASCNGLPQAQNQVVFDSLESAEASGYTAKNQCQRCMPYGSVAESTIETQNLNDNVSSSSGSYIGNVNNGKLHRASCSGLPKEQNRVYFDSKDEAMAAGYSDPCGRCHP